VIPNRTLRGWFDGWLVRAASYELMRVPSRKLLGQISLLGG